MSKQDRQGVRTPAALEQKYELNLIKKNQANSNNQNIQLNQLRQEFAQYKKSVNGDIETFNQFKTDTNTKLEELEENDKMWFYSGTPTLENYPAVNWTTDELKAKHMGDMYYDVDNGNMYIFKYVDKVYSWENCFGNVGSYDEGYDKGYTEGQNSVQNHFKYAVGMKEMFLNVAFPDGYELSADLPNITSLANAFQGATGVEKVTLKGNDNENAVNFASAFRNCENLKALDLTKFNAKISSFSMTFYFASATYEILGELDLTECTSVRYAFTNCVALEELRLKGSLTINGFDIHNSTKFSKASLLSILSVLNTTVSDVAVTLPTNCIDGATDTLTTIQNDTELNSAYTTAIANGYTIAFA